MFEHYDRGADEKENKGNNHLVKAQIPTESQPADRLL